MNTTRQTLAVLLLLISASTFSQEKTLYFNYNGKPTTPDSAQRIRKGTPENGKWHVLEYEKLQSKPRSEAWYLDSSFLIPDGPYTEYADYGDKAVTHGQYSRGKQTGLWLSFFASGKLHDSTMYVDGHISYHRVFYESGRLRGADSIGVGGSGNSTGYREDGRLEHTGQFVQWKKSGPWSYYTKQGVLCSVETMNADTIFSATDYDATGKIASVHKGAYEQESEYPGGAGAWRQYLNKKMTSARLPKEYTDGKVHGTVIVQFIIDETGMPTDIQVVQSVYPALDALVTDAIRNSKTWLPAYQHNRAVKSYKKQPIAFSLVER